MVRTIPLTNKRTSLVCVCGGGGGCNLNNYGKDYTLNKQEDISGVCVCGGGGCNLNNYGKDYTLNKQEDISGVCVCVGGV